MNCEEFLRQFRDTLDGKVSENVIQDNVNYYRSYINSQIAAGQSEPDVLRMLGDPRLLAKTIEESSKFASEKNQSGYTGEYGNFGNFQNFNTAGSAAGEYTDPVEPKRGRLPGWLIACIVMVVVFVGLSIVFRVFLFLAPYIIVFFLAGFLVRTVRNWWQRR